MMPYTGRHLLIAAAILFALGGALAWLLIRGF